MGRVFRNNYKGHMNKTKWGRDPGREVGMAGVVGGMVGGKGRQLYLNNNKKIYFQDYLLPLRKEEFQGNKQASQGSTQICSHSLCEVTAPEGFERHRFPAFMCPTLSDYLTVFSPLQSLTPCLTFVPCLGSLEILP